MCPVDSEGVEGLCVYYWSKFSAPPLISDELRKVNPNRLQRRLPGTNKVLFSKNEERYYLEKDEDTLRLLGSTAFPIILFVFSFIEIGRKS